MGNSPYVFVDSPYKDFLEGVVRKIENSLNERGKQEEKDAIENALYFAVQKRMITRVFESNEEYLIGLLSDISDAQFEFGQVCYKNRLSVVVH